MIAACGSQSSSSGNTQPAADTTAPTIALSASSAMPQGGETVVLTTDVTDNRDTGLTATTSCDNGTLRGDFLIIPETQTGLTIVCTATAQDAAGNEGTAALTIDVEPTITSVALAGGQNQAAQGQAIVLFTENLTPSLPTYTGQLSGVEVTINADVAGGLNVFVPFDMPPGEHILSITIDGQLFSFVITVEETPNVADPERLIADTVEQSLQALDQLMADPAFMFSATDISFFQTIIADARAALDDLAEQSPEDLALVAKLITANKDALVFSQGPMLSAMNLDEEDTCFDLATQYSIDVTATAVKILVIAAIGGATASGALVATGPFAPIFVVLGAGIAVGGISSILYDAVSESGLSAAFSNAYSCVIDRAETQFNLTTSGLDAAAEQAPQKGTSSVATITSELTSPIFILDQPSTVRLERVTAPDSPAAELVFDARDRLVSAWRAVTYLPDSAIDDMINAKSQIVEEVMGALSLATISNSDINGVIENEGTNRSLAFGYSAADLDQLDDGIDFTFSLTQMSEPRGTFNATLTATPQANDAMITVIADTPSEFDVNAFGSGALVTAEPSKGRVQIVDYNTFIYTADPGTLGDDNFTYAATLGTKQSPSATVFVNIVADVPQVNAAAFTLVVEDTPSGQADFDLEIDNADRIQIVRAPTQGTIKNLQPDGRFTYAVNDGAFGDDSFDYTAQNAAGVSQTATATITIVPLPVDCSVFEDLVLGNWIVQTGPTPDGRADLELFDGPEGTTGGTGIYTVDGDTFPMSWSIREVGPGASNLGVAPGCVLVDTGFFNAGFDGLLRSNLTNPVTTHFKYELGGVFGFPPEGNYFGLDLSSETPNVTFTKQ